MDPDALHHAHEEHGDEEEGAAVGDEGDGDADDGEDIEVHADILEGVGEEHGDDANGEKASELVAGVVGDKDSLEEEEEHGGEHQQGTAEAEFLGDDSEDEVVDGFVGEEGAVDGAAFGGLDGEGAFAFEAGGADGEFEVVGDPAFFFHVHLVPLVGVHVDGGIDAEFLVVFEAEEVNERDDTEDTEDEYDEVAERDAASEHEAEEDGAPD